MFFGDKNELALPDAASIAPSEEPEVDFRKRIKYGNRIQASWAVLSEFFANSTVHGVRYFSEYRRHWTERVFWVITFVLSVCFCGYLIHNVWMKWNQSPVIVSFDEKTTPVWAIPFPAVTICPETKSYMSRLNFTDVYHQLEENGGPTANMSEEMIMRTEAIIQVCNIGWPNPFGEPFTNETFFDTIRDIAPSLNDTMELCNWRNGTDHCSAFFRPILTEEGICFTFNAMNSREIYTEEMAPGMMSVTNNPNATKWNLEDGYDNSKSHSSEPTYPYRVLGTGALAGLDVELRLFEQDFDHLCRYGAQGFKVLLHTPGEVPQVSKHFFRVPLKQEVLVSVKPNIITTADSLRYYRPNKRRCYLNSERQLRFFKVYTQRNCELECLSNFTKNACGCVKFSLPRDQNTTVCGAAKKQCYYNAAYKFLEKEFTERTTIEEAERKVCNCLPACTSITYDTEISQAYFNKNNFFRAMKKPDSKAEGTQQARLSIFFKENEFITSKRSELYGPTDFLAYCGGLLGLLLGMSVLSVVEVIYYFTLRLSCTLRIFRKHAQGNTVAPADQNTPGIMIVGTTDEKDVY